MRLEYMHVDEVVVLLEYLQEEGRNRKQSGLETNQFDTCRRSHLIRCNPDNGTDRNRLPEITISALSAQMDSLPMLLRPYSQICISHSFISNPLS